MPTTSPSWRPIVTASLAIAEVDALPAKHPLRETTLERLMQWRVRLSQRHDATEEAREFMANTARVYENWKRRMLQAGKVEEFPAVFITVEHLLEQGDEDARAAVTTGLLEDLYFEAEYAGISPREWRKYFGTRAIKAWEAYLVWAKKSD